MSSLRHREGDLQELPGERPLPTAHAKSCSHKAQQHWTIMKLKLISPPSSTFFCCSHYDPTTAHRKHPHSPAAQEDWARTTAAGQTSSPLICMLSNNAFPRGVEGCYRGPAGRGPPAEQQTEQRCQQQQWFPDGDRSTSPLPMPPRSLRIPKNELLIPI